MPYLQQSWTQYIRESSCGKNQCPSTNERPLRTGPYESSKTKEPSRESHELTRAPPYERAKLLTMRNVIRGQVEDIYRNRAALPTEDESFFQYTIKPDEVIFCGKYSNIYLSHHNDHSDFPLIGRVFEPTARIEAHRSMYLKILKHLGKKHPSIIATWDIYYDANGRIVIFQEFAIHGNLLDYLKTNNVFVPESQLVEWVQQIYRAMDFLGDIGVCHRSITPKHVLLTPSEEPNKIDAKLGSFRDAVIYFDPRLCRVRNQPCRGLDKLNSGSFQAPEVYGKGNEDFDPIAADVWSFGACMFYAATRCYPFNYRQPSDNIDEEIQKTIEMSKTISSDAKRWFSGLLRADTNLRTTFDQIESDPWFKIQ